MPKPICDICQSKIQGILVFSYSHYPPLFFPPENLKTSLYFAMLLKWLIWRYFKVLRKTFLDRVHLYWILDWRNVKMDPGKYLNFTDNPAQIKYVFEIGNIPCQSPVVN